MGMQGFVATAGGVVQQVFNQRKPWRSSSRTMTASTEGIAIASISRSLDRHAHYYPQVGIAAQLPSGAFSTEDLDYSTFWDFLVKGNNAYEPLADVLSDFPQYVM
jgi:hypothetical protein